MPAIAELSLMPVTAQWLPIYDSFERQLVDRLVYEGRSFVKVLRYNLSRGRGCASAVLTDVGDPPTALCIVAGSNDRAESCTTDELGLTACASAWIWHSTRGAMPPLSPPRDCNHVQRGALKSSWRTTTSVSSGV